MEIPKSWSQTATNVVVSKYFRGQLGTPERESSVRQLIGRVADTVAALGPRGRLLRRRGGRRDLPRRAHPHPARPDACFNSPVWFNVGIEAKPQCSACFINSVDDTMESILELAKTEAMLFKFGSGTGTDLSTLRS